MLLASMFVGAVGFAVAFIANYPSSPSGLITLGASNVKKFHCSHNNIDFMKFILALYSLLELLISL